MGQGNSNNASTPVASEDRPRPAGPLRALTYLAPGIPLELFELVSAHLARSLSREVELESEVRSSGPMHGSLDPFAAGRADIGFLCSPSYIYLRSKPRPSIELVPAGFVFQDARHGGQPVYYSEFVVRAQHPARSFADFAGGSWGYNDDCSLSGYFAALQKLAELGREADFFARRVCTGSHHASIEAVLAGDVDGAAIDSTVLHRLSSKRPELVRRLRILESWGPFPIQPVVVRAGLGAGWAARIADVLLNLHRVEGLSARLTVFDLERFAPISDDAFADERRALCALGRTSA